MVTNEMKAERARRKAALARATVEGVETRRFSDRGREVAILCSGCNRPMLVVRRADDNSPARCLPCGPFPKEA